MAGKTPRGVWVAYTDGQNHPENVTIESSELKALRVAVGMGGRSVFVDFGQTLIDAIEGIRKASAGRLPGEEPIPGMPADEPPEDPAPETKPARKRGAPAAE